MGRKKRRKMRRSRGRRRRTTTMRRRERRRRRRSSRATAPSSPPGGRWGCGSRHRNFGLPRPDGRSSPQLLRRGPQPHLPLEGKKVCLTQKRRQYHSLNKPHQDTFTHARLTRMRVARNARGLRGLAARVEVPPSTSATYIARAAVPHPHGQGRRLVGRRLSRPSRSALTPSKPRPYVARGRAVYPGQVALAGVAAARRCPRSSR